MKRRLHRHFSPTTGLALTLLIAIEWGLTLQTAQARPRTFVNQSLVAQASTSRSVIHVNNRQGNDRRGNGSLQAPLKTITQALAIAPPNSVIQLASGTYSEATGESFPLTLKPGITLQGDPQTKGQGIIIRGGGYFLSRTDAGQNVAVLGANQARVEGVTITNPNTRGYGLWIEFASLVVENNTFTGNLHDGVSVTGSSHPVIQYNVFKNNGANGITVYGTSRAKIQENQFENTGFALNINQDAQPQVLNNQIINNRDGVIVQGRATPVLRGNVIQGNERSGLAAVGDAQPNLGTSGDPGGNIFRNNGEYAIHAQASSQIVPAYGNTASAEKTSGRVDWRGIVQVRNVATTTPTPSPRPILNRPQPAFARPSIPATTPAPRAQPSQSPPTWVAPDGVEIPVIGPSSTTPTLSPNPVVSANPELSTASQDISAPPPPSSLLEVPDLPIPLGQTELPSVSVSRTPWTQTPRSSPAALGLQYKVIVNASDPSTQSRVKSVVPTAFRTRINGQSAMQAGAFRDRAEAEKLYRQLLGQGLRAEIVEYL